MVVQPPSDASVGAWFHFLYLVGNKSLGYLTFLVAAWFKLSQYLDSKKLSAHIEESKAAHAAEQMNQHIISSQVATSEGSSIAIAPVAPPVIEPKSLK